MSHEEYGSAEYTSDDERSKVMDKERTDRMTMLSDLKNKHKDSLAPEELEGVLKAKSEAVDGRYDFSVGSIDYTVSLTPGDEYVYDMGRRRTKEQATDFFEKYGPILKAIQSFDEEHKS